MTLITENKMYDNWQILYDCLHWLCGEKSHKGLPYYKMLQEKEPKPVKDSCGGKRK